MLGSGARSKENTVQRENPALVHSYGHVHRLVTRYGVIWTKGIRARHLQDILHRSRPNFFRHSTRNSVFPCATVDNLERSWILFVNDRGGLGNFFKPSTVPPE